MNNILNELLGQIGDNGLQEISKQVGATPDQTANAIGGIIPTLLGAMSKNAQSPEGAQGLLGALDKDHDGSLLENIAGFASNFTSGPGAGILKHVLGGQQPQVENQLSSKTGLNAGQISNLMKIAAPIVLAYLGKQKRQNPSAGFDPSNIAGLLSGLTGQADKSTGIDLGDILQMVGGLTGNATASGGGGGILGGLLKSFLRK